MTVIRCVSPVNGEVYAEREALTPEQATAGVERARAAQGAWAARPLEERIALVQEGVKRLNGLKDRVVEELAWQMGRPVRYGGEFGGLNERAAYMGGIAAEALAPMVAEDSDRFERRIERAPVGVVFVIAPWNYPYLTSCNTIIPALIAGNSVIHKSASQTLLVGERWAEAFDGLLPPGVFQNVVLDHEGTEGLIRARSFGFVNFTGSVAGGAAIERAAAGTFTPLGLELGGKDPGYVMEDADLDWAVDVLMDGAMFNAGQCCCGIERIYVHRSLYDGFLDRAVAWTKQLKLGNPLEVSTSIGPMANRRFADTVRAQTAEAVAAGATPLIGREVFPEDDGGTYLSPQILVNVDHSMRVMREESFGPVVGVMPVDGDEQALQLMNDSPYGLTASLWTQDAERAARLGRRIDTGSVYMNRADYLDPALCWTGTKDTGRGAALSVLGYHSVTRPRSYHFRKAKG
ncbi:aldehyde dehydrogenase family protein [Rubellimicrobium arenae]|uniref:aldehyde dehydrogenase family protein n=1 Tax=Rubellimicrobium arenae TaxID=2817372 RepID=UPI001B306932|nr:aldehyde dehydrogenase family protein [Rubellimicrobium arenae]